MRGQQEDDENENDENCEKRHGCSSEKSTFKARAMSMRRWLGLRVAGLLERLLRRVYRYATEGDQPAPNPAPVPAPEEEVSLEEFIDRLERANARLGVGWKPEGLAAHGWYLTKHGWLARFPAGVTSGWDALSVHHTPAEKLTEAECGELYLNNFAFPVVELDEEEMKRYLAAGGGTYADYCKSLDL